MDRRSFLRGLLALPVAAELGRVYSFPTTIVIPKAGCIGGIAHLPQSTVVYYNKPFLANLKAGVHLLYADYLHYSDLALISAIDPVVAKVAAEMAERVRRDSLGGANGHRIQTLVESGGEREQTNIRV